MSEQRKRAVVIFGAGASVEYGIPATAPLTKKITEKINNDPRFKGLKVAEVYNYVKDTLEKYYGDENQAHFERIYHVVHELFAHYHHDKAVSKFLPVMAPFLSAENHFEQVDFLATVKAIIEIIYAEASVACDSKDVDLTSLRNFFSYLEAQYIPRIYTTNYDNFVDKAIENKYSTGFTRKFNNCKLFDSKSFFKTWNEPCLYHLHGSIHMGYVTPETLNTEIGELAWYDDTKDALQNAFITASGISRMDGTMFERTSIITGLEKLGRLQQNPYAFYYSQLSRDIMEADVIFVIGSGLADLHINKWLHEVRKNKPKTPLVLVGYWDKDAFGDVTDFEISLMHDLNVKNSVRDNQEENWNDWNLYPQNNAATWHLGFHSFLEDVNKLDEVLNKINPSI